MSIAKKIYAALKQEFPGYSNAKIARTVGVGHSGVSKLCKGKGIGVIAAQWLAENREGYDDLYAEAVAEQKRVIKQNVYNSKQTRNRKRKQQLSDFPVRIQRFIGYIDLSNRGMSK